MAGWGRRGLGETWGKEEEEEAAIRIAVADTHARTHTRNGRGKKPAAGERMGRRELAS